MRVDFQECMDIFLFLTPYELKKLKRTSYATPALSAKSNDGIDFYIMNSEKSNGVEVRVPRDPKGTYWVTISDTIYEMLMRQKKYVPERYDGEHKIGIVIEKAKYFKPTLCRKPE